MADIVVVVLDGSSNGAFAVAKQVAWHPMDISAHMAVRSAMAICSGESEVVWVRSLTETANDCLVEPW
jgi:hypothetical protein